MVPTTSRYLAQVQIIMRRPKFRPRKRKRKRSYARLDAWVRAMIWALSLVAAERAEIRKKIDKTDGTMPSLQAVDATLAKKRKKS